MNEEFDFMKYVEVDESKLSSSENYKYVELIISKPMVSFLLFKVPEKFELKDIYKDTYKKIIEQEIDKKSNYEWDECCNSLYEIDEISYVDEEYAKSFKVNILN